MTDQATVFVVDDDQAVRESLALLAASVGLAAKTFASAKAFLDDYRAEQPGCVIVDIRMPGMSGLELQERLASGNSCIPVIILTGHADVPAAVRAMKGGAVDFVQKPFNAHSLIELIQEALRRDAEARRAAVEASKVAERIANLTPREREVMGEIVAGKANKVIAIDFEISERTVELHRSRIMKKMQARSVAALVRMVLPNEFGALALKGDASKADE